MANRNVLLVEGSDDEHVVKHICGNRGIPHLDEISHHGGAKGVLKEGFAEEEDAIKQTEKVFSTSIKLAQEGDTFGIIIDADTDLDARWQSIRHKTVEAGYNEVPNQPNLRGTILTPPANSRLPRLGIWIMPNNRTNGILENFLEFLVPNGDGLLEYARGCVEDLPSRRFIHNDAPKAVMHTWLAWQSEPGKPYGTAITAKFLDPNVAEADILVEWLKNLYFPNV